VAEDFNPHSFINANDFASEEALLEHICRVDSEEALYRRYFEEPFFAGNRPNQCFDFGRIQDFFDRIVADPQPPLAVRQRRLFRRWMVLKRKSPHPVSRQATKLSWGFVR